VRKLFLLFCLPLIVVSCINNIKHEKPQDNLKTSEDFVYEFQKQELSIGYLTEDWGEYNTLTNFITSRFKKTNTQEALSNAKELTLLVKKLNDSIRPELLKTASFKARANILYNETLRLEDLSSIQNIQSKEVNHQVTKIIEAYNSLNSKIATVIMQKKLETELSNSKDQ